MFASEGFFRGVCCPFFASGLCHRPYCHFKHADRQGKQRKRKDFRHIGGQAEAKDDVAEPSKQSDESTAASKKETPLGGKHDSGAAGNDSATADSRVDGEVSSLTAKRVESERPGLFSDSPTPPSAGADCESNDSSPPNPDADERSDEVEKKVEKPIISVTYQSCPDDFEVISETFSADETSSAVDFTNKVKAAPGEHHEEDGQKEDTSDDGMILRKSDEKEVCLSVEDVLNAYSSPLVTTSQPVCIEAAPSSSKAFKVDEDQSSRMYAAVETGMALKKRIAHAGASAVHDTHGRSGPRRPASGRAPDPPLPFGLKTGQGYDNDVYSTVAKKRLAHQVSVQKSSSAKRPVIPLMAGGKIPRNLRQRFLDAYIDSYIELGMATTEAFDKALDEEQSLMKRSSSRQLYTNKAAVHLSRLRQQIQAKKGASASKSKKANTESGGSSPVTIRPSTSMSMSQSSQRSANSISQTPSKASVPQTSPRLSADLRRLSSSSGSSQPSFLVRSTPSPMKRSKAEPDIFGFCKGGGLKIVTHQSNVRSSAGSAPDAVEGPRKKHSKSSERKDSQVSPLVNARVTGFGRDSSFSIEKKAMAEKELTEGEFYKQLLTYLASEQQLVENGYPRPGATPGTVSISYSDGRRKPHRVDSLGNNEFRYVCCRCGLPFVINRCGRYQTNECTYHHGRAHKHRDGGELVMTYSCCQAPGGSTGCQVAKCHVWDGVVPGKPLSGYMQTKRRSSAPIVTQPVDKVFAFDCEMCYTSVGLELCRITVVDFRLRVILDMFVKPSAPVVDYNTRFSGVTEKDLDGVCVHLEDIQRHLLSLFTADTILVGHSLESDLKAVKLLHSRVVDTSLVFPHKLGQPYKRALRNLAAEVLNKVIQEGAGGHDSSEDATVAMELMIKKVKDDMMKASRKATTVRVFK